MPSATYDEFVSYIRDLSTLHQIGALLGWDQETMMPPKAAEGRGNQMAMIAGLAHERATSDELGKMLEQLKDEGANSDDPAVTTNIREMQRRFDRSTKLPTDLVKEIAKETTLSQTAWQKARAASDFSAFAPNLDRMLDLQRQVADKIGWDTEPYDALMDEYEPRMTAGEVQQVFDDLKQVLVPLVAAIKDAPQQPDLSILERHCPADAQRSFSMEVIKRMHFDLEAGRLDTSTHPFCSGTTPSDVRLTTRYEENFFPSALFGSMHEAGHGLYEQGLDSRYVGTPMCDSVSLGIHESQSRLWENQVGRSRPFWEGLYPRFQEMFASMKEVALDDFMFAINSVRPTYIRVEADEVTYGLHIMLRFDIEREMISGKLSTSEVPARWNELFTQYFGITPKDDAEGCLQDIHWSMGAFGYFPTYQLGNIYSAQFFAAARQALPDLDGQIRAGDLKPLREWLREHIHQPGMRYSAKELVKVVTGAEFNAQPYIEYLNSKFKPLYGLS